MNCSRSISCFRFRPATAHPRIWHSHKYVNSSFYPAEADSVWTPPGRLIHIRTGKWLGLDRKGLKVRRMSGATGVGRRRFCLLQIARHQEGFRGLVPRSLGLALHHPLEALLEGLHDLRKTAAVESLDDQQIGRASCREGAWGSGG